MHKPWRLSALSVAAVVILPLSVLLFSWYEVPVDIWQHLLETQLGRLIGNTLTLLTGVGVGVTVLGVSLAWLTATCEFPGRNWLDKALFLPFAMPAYVLAFVYVGLLDFSGPVQTALRQWFGIRSLPEFRSTGGVIAVLVLVFYPYVYMLARTAFRTQGRQLFDAARILGRSPLQAFISVALPMAKPAIMAGVSLALMETLADFGTVSVFNYDTFTTAIYKSWYGFFNLQAAAQLATLLLLLVALMVFGERKARGSARFTQSQIRHNNPRFQLSGIQSWLASGFCTVVVLLAFVVPVAQLLQWAVSVIDIELDARYWERITNTLLLGVMAAVITVGAALILALAKRLQPDRWTNFAASVGTLGYALPGSVLAVGIMIGFSWIDKGVLIPLASWLGMEPQMWLVGSLPALLLAYMVRFMAVGYGPVDSALQRLKPSIPEAARSLGVGGKSLVRRVYLPVIAPGTLTALLLVMVDVLKEMPATMLLRPFGWETLAVCIYQMTAEGEWERAALPAVILLLTGMIPVIMLMRRAEK
ncbi:ABC transporter permease [Endozoicomonadaceae bacterium StTr2]